MTKTLDALGDRMKGYEMAEAGRRLTPMLPALARLDGKCFSSFTRGLKRPYDERLSSMMISVTKRLVDVTGACCGYTQSDEITLAWYSSDPKSQIYFDGRVQKMVSVLAAECSVFFNDLLGASMLPEKMYLSPVFDCRVWCVPTLEEGANCFLWREQDATKNSIGMVAGEYYSHKELMGKHSGEKQEMLFAKGVNWNDYPDFFKRGTYVQRRKERRRLTVEELADLPPLHEARKNPELEFERSVVRRLSMPPLAKVTNRVGAIFFGEEPYQMTKETV